jgi:hypothetical protein
MGAISPGCSHALLKSRKDTVVKDFPLRLGQDIGRVFLKPKSVYGEGADPCPSRSKFSIDAAEFLREGPPASTNKTDNGAQGYLPLLSLWPFSLAIRSRSACAAAGPTNLEIAA